MFVVIVEFSVRQEHLNEFLELMKSQAHNTIKEEGCIRFDICQSIVEKELIFLYEIYKDESAFREHLKQNYFWEFSEKTVPWIKVKKVTELQLIESNK